MADVHVHAPLGQYELEAIGVPSRACDCGIHKPLIEDSSKKEKTNPVKFDELPRKLPAPPYQHGTFVVS